MEQIKEVLLKSKLIVVVVVVFCLLYVVVMIFQTKGIKKRSDDFLAQHPDASKIFLTLGAISIKEPVGIYAVNKETPVTFMEGRKTGILVLPGENVLQASYSYTRPGVVHKTVTTQYGPEDVVVEIEPNKSYKITFDRKAEIFEFNEPQIVKLSETA